MEESDRSKNMWDLEARTALVSLLKDLKLLLESYDHTFEPTRYCMRPFTKHLIRSLYDDFGFLELYFTICSEDKKSKIIAAARAAANCIHVETRKFLDWDQLFVRFNEFYPDIYISFMPKERGSDRNQLSNARARDELYRIRRDVNMLRSVWIVEPKFSKRHWINGPFKIFFNTFFNNCLPSSSKGKNTTFTGMLNFYASSNPKEEESQLVGGERDSHEMLDCGTGRSSDLAVHTALVCLLDDLELLLSSYDLIFKTEKYCMRPFEKHEVQSLYDHFYSMDSLLGDSSGEYCDNDFLNDFRDRILNVTHRAASYIHAEIDRFFAWGQQFLLFNVSYPNIAISLNEKKSRCIAQGINARSNQLHDIEREIASIRHLFNNRIVPSEGTTFTGMPNFFPSSESEKEEDKLVGHEKDFEAMLDCLTGESPKLRFFSVIGMAGIGKTTFTKSLYDHPLVMHHFYVHAWITISQQYQEKEMLLGILRCVTISLPEEIYERSSDELRELVYKSLKGKRYFIVLDDIWDKKVWDDLRLVFPDDQNGSRVLLTSRLRNVAVHACGDTPPHFLQFLNMDESWELLCSKIFGNKSCPDELVKIGKQIAHKCQGLPLAIVVVGGLLSKMNKTVMDWETVAQQVGSLVMKEPYHCQEILALSYKHLPCHLKVCFLYMGIFPEDFDIPAQNLIRLWIAERFIYPRTLECLEEVAEGFLEDLVARSLILVKGRGSGGRIKICGIHDLMRDFCLRESQKENFHRVIKSYGEVPLIDQNDLDVRLTQEHGKESPADQYNLRRLSFHSGILKYMQSETPLLFTSSFICFETLRSTDIKKCSGVGLGLPKVLDIKYIQHITLPREILSYTHLKYVSLSVQNFYDILNIMPQLRNVQTLIVDCEWDGHLSREFWDMYELRHLEMKRSYLPNRPRPIESPTTSVLKGGLENLQSLSRVRTSSCMKSVFISMPRLKSLAILETEEDYQCHGWDWLENLVYLQELERLKYEFSNPFASPTMKPDRLPSSLDCFPQKLMKLTLTGTSLPWEDMVKISMLPKIEVLKLRNFAFCGKIWETSEGGFKCLKFLLISSTNLEEWKADGSHFPSLRHLALKNCRALKEIPYGFVEAPLLEKIELHQCEDSLDKSARRIQEEIKEFGNEGFALYVTERFLHKASQNQSDSPSLNHSDDHDCRPGTSGVKNDNVEISVSICPYGEDYWMSDDECLDGESNEIEEVADEPYSICNKV